MSFLARTICVRAALRLRDHLTAFFSIVARGLLNDIPITIGSVSHIYDVYQYALLEYTTSTVTVTYD